VLNVIGRVTSDVYKNTDKTIPQITKELNVDAAMEVDVMCFGEKVCFQYRLQSGGTKERQLGTGDHSEPKGNLFNVYNQIIKQIADEVKQSLTPEQKAKLAESRTINPEAIDVVTYVEGLNRQTNFSYDTLIKAMDLLNHAIEKEPDWSPLYSWRGVVWYMFSLAGYESPDSTYPKVYENINRALALDPDNAGAHGLTAELAITQEWDWEKAETEFRKALELGETGWDLRYAGLLWVLQRPEEGRKIVARAFKRDPKNRAVQVYYVYAMLNDRDYKSAMSFIEDLLVTDPDGNFYPLMEYAALGCGNLSKMFEVITGYQFDEGTIAAIEKIYDERGFNAAYEEIIRQLENLNEKGYILNWTLAFYYYAINQDDKAMDYFEKSAKAHEYVADIGTGIYDFSRLYDNPRFIALMKKMNLPLPKSD
jgi:adenylate cyclase